MEKAITLFLYPNIYVLSLLPYNPSTAEAEIKKKSVNILAAVKKCLITLNMSHNHPTSQEKASFSNE